MQSPPSAVLVNLGGFSLHYYGIIMFFAIISAIFVMRYVAKKFFKDVDTEILLDILPVIILCSILGARTYYVLMDFSYYSKHLAEIPALWHGGMSIHGGLLGGILSGIVMAKIKKFSFLKYADIFAYGLLIGQAIGRFGNYFNCEAFGKPCSIPFIKLYIPPQYRPFGYEHFEYFHPAFLYESLWNLFVFAILFCILKKFKNLPDGAIFFAYLILYSIGRILIEYCRLDSVRYVGGIAVAQVVSAIVITVSAVVLIFLFKNKKKG